MTRRSAKNGYATRASHRLAGQVQYRVLLLAVFCFLAGLALSAVWVKRVPQGPEAPSQTGVPVSTDLSGTTRAVLQGLDKPLELKFYSLLDSPATPESLRALAGHVTRLLAAYETAAGGKLKVVSITSQSYANANAAVADGLKAITLPNGDTCFLGVSVARAGYKDAVSNLAPEWENAVEPDLTRAIVRVVEATSARPAGTPPAPPPVATIDALKRALPNLDSLSEQDATRMLRETALTEFAQATHQMEAAMKEAQQRLEDAQKSQSPEQQQAAMKQLQQLQAEQTEKLRQIAANSQTQIQALQQYKSLGR